MGRKALDPLPKFSPRTPKQAEYHRQIHQYDMTFGVGPAGTGKTHVVAQVAAELFEAGKIDRLIIIRPTIAVEGEDLGALPGGLDEKMAPWARPVFDELAKVACAERRKSWQIEPVPIAFIRGRTFDDALIHVSEAQNLTMAQAKAIVTRVGANSKLVIEGDPDQSDLPSVNTLAQIIRCAGFTGVDFGLSRFVVDDVVRSPLAQAWLRAFRITDQEELPHKRAA